MDSTPESIPNEEDYRCFEGDGFNTPCMLDPIREERVLHVEKEEIKEKLIEVTEIRYIEKYVEIPIIEYVEKIKHVEKPVYKEEIRHVRVPVYEEKIIEIPQIEWIERIVEIPKYIYKEKIIHEPDYVVVEHVIPVLKPQSCEKTITLKKLNGQELFESSLPSLGEFKETISTTTSLKLGLDSKLQDDSEMINNSENNQNDIINPCFPLSCSNYGSNPVADQLSNRISDQLSNQLSNQISNQLSNQISNQISNQAANSGVEMRRRQKNSKMDKVPIKLAVVPRRTKGTEEGKRCCG